MGSNYGMITRSHLVSFKKFQWAGRLLNILVVVLADPLLQAAS